VRAVLIEMLINDDIKENDDNKEDDDKDDDDKEKKMIHIN